MTKGPAPRNPYQRYRPFKKPKLEPMVTTLWDYPSQHYVSPSGAREQGSQRYRGATPSWVVWQVIQRFTAPGDLVLDPFCGSGTTLDVCRDTERRGIGFDLAPTRDDIQRGDARQLPLDDESVALAFLDPPYADNLDYSDDPACIGRLRADDGSWHDAMDAVLLEMARVVRPGGHMAIYVQDIRKKARFFPLGVDLAAMGQAHFRLVDHVCVVRRNKDLEKGNYRKAALEQGFLLRGFNHLLLFERPKPPARQAGGAKKKSRQKSRQKSNQTSGKKRDTQSRSRSSTTAGPTKKRRRSPKR